MKITLIRHGLSISNEKKVYTGHSDVSLSVNGINQLNDLVECYDFPKGDLFISSPLKRCVETFSILYPHEEIDKLFNDLKETNFGDWEGKSYQDLKNDVNYRKWMDDYEHTIPPNGECFLDFNKRIEVVFKKIIEYGKEFDKTDIVVMTHGGVIRSIMSQIIDTNVPFFNWEIPNGLGYQIIIDDTYEYSEIKAFDLKN